MSWFTRSIANSLKSDTTSSEEDEDTIIKTLNTPKKQQDERDNRGGGGGGEEEENPSRGVKEDLSELTKTLSRQFWGVASFLAPPPSPTAAAASRPSFPDPEPNSDADPPALSGIRSDFAEIGGRFKTGISKLSSNMAVTEISKIASSFLPFGSEEEEPGSEGSATGGAVGVTEEVLAFARNISMHPETWLDFPLFTDDEDSDDFDMSDAQQEHALAVERLAPRLAALRIELCPGHMSEGCFWKIYFVLLHSRLNKHDAELLSTPQIVEARALWLQELQNRTKPLTDRLGIGTSHIKEPVPSDSEEHAPPSNISSERAPIRTFAYESVNTAHAADIETDKHPLISTEIKIIDKSVVEEGPTIQTTDINISSGASKALGHKYEEEGDDWLEEDNTEMGGTTIPLGNEEDVSFSDLEDDDERSAPASSKTVTDVSDCSTKDSTGWVQLSRNTGESTKNGHASMGHHGDETKESSDWLNLDEELDTD
ncbi:hypothetical protein MRB53_007411 [Persea americana]|uniref:Uncharacterized protein n=1 Tax=Persea americana TaxID=3435 RepID=A0ACC2MJG8_PERAE|nr:hypothetical protein MRB53_007411 [Persea americana]